MAVMSQVAHVPILLSFAPKKALSATRGYGTNIVYRVRKPSVTAQSPIKVNASTRGYGVVLVYTARQIRTVKPFYWS